MYAELHFLTHSLSGHRTEAFHLCGHRAGDQELLYQMHCQELGELHLLIVQPNLESSLGYEQSFCFGKEGSHGEEQELVQTYCFAKT